MNDSEYYRKTIKRIKAKTIYRGDCWIYTGLLNRGYDQIKYRGKTIRIHRLICSKIYKKDIDDLKWIACHETICTSRACWNPAHLRADTHSSNSKDAIEKGTHNFLNRVHHNSIKTHCKKGHLYDGTNNVGGRICKKCKLQNDRDYLRKKKLQQEMVKQ